MTIKTKLLRFDEFVFSKGPNASDAKRTCSRDFLFKVIKGFRKKHDISDLIDFQGIGCGPKMLILTMQLILVLNQLGRPYPNRHGHHAF